MGHPQHVEHPHTHTHSPTGTDADADADAAAMAELLDLDAEVLHAPLSQVISWVRERTADRPPRRVLDLGAGTGTGTLALLSGFDDAEAVAVDASAEFLHHLQAAATARGLGDRVRTVHADLDVAWPAPEAPEGSFDLVWASSSLHHLGDPDRVLGEVLAALRPGGLLVAVELGGFPRFLPDDAGVGRPGLEDRAHDALAPAHTDRVPLLGADWNPRLAAAGFTVEAERPLEVHLTPPLPPSAGRYAQATLRRVRSALDGRMAADDLAALDALLDDDGPVALRRRTDLTVRTTRTVWTASRPPR